MKTKVKLIYTLIHTQRSTFGTRPDRVYKLVGTVDELIEKCNYTLQCGRSYQHEKGNKKINMKPRGIDQLCKNLENAKSNSAANGYSGSSYTYELVDPSQTETEPSRNE